MTTRANRDARALEQRLRAQLRSLREKPNGILEYHSEGDHAVVLLKVGNELQLFTPAHPQPTSQEYLGGMMSRIDITRPLYLLATYTQAAMLALVWKRYPKRIYVLGFGGGRLPLAFKYCVPECEIIGSEVSPSVVSIAQRYFGLNGQCHMPVSVMDGRQHLESLDHDSRFDIIILDSYLDTYAVPFHLSTLEFYDICRKHLAPGGIVVFNMIESDPLFAERFLTFTRSFTSVYEFVDQGIHVLFGMPSDATTTANFVRSAIRVAAGCEIRFPFVKHAKKVKRIDEIDLMRRYGSRPSLSDKPKAELDLHRLLGIRRV